MANAEDWVADAADDVGGLDLLLTDAALGLRRMVRPGSALRLAAALGRNPRLVASKGASLGAHLTMITAGRSALRPAPKDRRFADPAWTANPLLRRVVQAYLAAELTAGELLDGAALDWRDDTRLRFLLTNLIAAAAPSNNPLISPVAWKALIDTGGLSIARGLRALAVDMSAAPRVPAMVPAEAFNVGTTLAVTPGAIVRRTELFELIQYQPDTGTVYKNPLVIVPPMINKYYITDLAPGRSMAEYLTAQGHQVFTISWRNPDARHRHWGLDSYGTAIVQALDTAREITGAAQVSVCALCSGGIVTSMVAAHLKDTGRLGELASLCLGVTVLDQYRAGTAAAMISETTAAAAKAASATRGYLDGRALAEVFAWLRPDDLVWNYWVNNYLQGKQPPAFDILYWNADTTRLPAALHAGFIDLAMQNALTKPGVARMLGSPVDLTKVDTDAYVIAAIADHICPWQSCYRTTQLLGGPVKFVLSTSGHIAAMVNPPGSPKAKFRTASANPADPGEFLMGATDVAGSWWPDYSAWLAARSGSSVPAAGRLGSDTFPVLCAAPGTYVHDH